MSRIEVRGAPFPITVTLRRASKPYFEDTWECLVTASVRHRDTGDPIEVTTFARHYDEQRREELPIGLVAELARRALKDFLAHEADEWLHVDGERVFDPHRRPPNV